jgi:NAD-dependent dihydropyrimidine dehydrogenase PreA subunit
VRCLCRHLPDGLHHLHRSNGEEATCEQRLKAPALNLAQDLYVSAELKTGRVMVKDEDVCLHCGLCAERCPTGAWDMQKFLLTTTQAGPACREPVQQSPGGDSMKRIEAVNDFVIKFANVNGSGSASANELFAKAVMRMGVPVSPRNIFPSNIQGCRPGTRRGSARRATTAGAAVST